VTRYILQRLLLLPFLLLVYSFVIFAIIHAPPGDFLTSYVATLTATGTSITADQINALRH
jgi:peptide/nickel transport system permease protein